LSSDINNRIMPHADIFMNIIAGCESGELIMATADV
jgi:hypothetical protein